MPVINEVKLSGTITKYYPGLTTPSGRQINRFVLEHLSEQLEAGVSRIVKCRIFCVYIQDDIVMESLNNHVNIKGFLSVNSQNKLVLHVNEIKFLD